MASTIVVGNPKPASRTLDAAQRLTHELTGGPSDHVVDLTLMTEDLIHDEGPRLEGTIATLAGSSLVVVASPTYKGTYTGLLKLFIDRLPGGDDLSRVIAVPLMLGGDMRHSLAADIFLRPLLCEVGFVCPAPGLFLVDSSYHDDGRLERYASRWAPTLRGS